MTFDRLIYVDRLRQAGVTEELAHTHAEALGDALAETVATKADLKDLADQVDRRFDALDRKFEAKFEQLDRKIEITARDLTIKGAAGLAIIASIIIGLELFG